MPKKHYEWGSTPKLGDHSKKKLEILREYIIKYIQIYAKPFQVAKLNITFVDGFCGGGSYQGLNQNNPIDGSPFVILKAAQEGEMRANQNREKTFKVAYDCYFVDENKEAVDVLTTSMKNSRFAGDLANGNVKILHAKFQEKLKCIVTSIKKRSKQAHALFFLDQYGYTAVSLSLIQYILGELPNAEIIFVLNIDSLFVRNFKSNLNSFIANTSFIRTGAQKNRMVELYEQGGSRCRPIIEKFICDSILTNCPNTYHEPFFIDNPDGFGYWFIHVSRHPAARHAMNDILWDEMNIHRPLQADSPYGIKQYGETGLDRWNIYGYSPRYDEKLTSGDLFGVNFSEQHRQENMERLYDQIPKIISDKSRPFRQGTSTVKDFINATCNYTSASKKDYLEILSYLNSSKDIVLVNADGSPRRSNTKTIESLIIKPVGQGRLIFT